MTFVGSSSMSKLYVGSQPALRIYTGSVMSWQPYAGDGSLELVEYTGTGTNPRTQTGLPFAPGLTLFTNNANSSVYPRYFLDALSASKPSYYAANSVIPQTSGFSGFTADGWVSNSSVFNTSGKLYQVFVWPKGDATLEFNSNGTLGTSQYANPSSGWSGGTYVGNGVSGATFGHGLSTSPTAVFIWGDTDPYTNGRFWGAGFGSYALYNWSETGGEYGNNGILSVDGSTVTIDGRRAVNELGAECTYICFTDVPGLIASGVANGNGVDPVVVSTGFQPRLIMMAGTGTGDNAFLYYYTARTDQTAPYFANYRTNTASSTPDPQPVSTKVQILTDGFQIDATNRGNDGSDPAFWIAFK